MQPNITMKIRIYQPDPNLLGVRATNFRKKEDLLRINPERYNLVYEGDELEYAETASIETDFSSYSEMPTNYHGTKLQNGDLLIIDPDNRDQIYMFSVVERWLDGTFEPIATTGEFDLSKAADRRNQFCVVHLPIGQYASIKWVPVDTRKFPSELHITNWQVLDIPFHGVQLICHKDALCSMPKPEVMNRALVNHNKGPDAIACIIQRNACFCNYREGIYRSLGAVSCNCLLNEYHMPERLHVLNGGTKLTTFRYYPESCGSIATY